MTLILQNILDAASAGSLYALTALGIGLLFSVLQLVNFAQGDFVSIGAYSLVVPSTSATAVMFIGSAPWPILIVAVAATVVLFAVASAIVVFRPLRGASAATMMIGSFALSFIIQNALLMIYGGRPKAIDLWSALGSPIVVGNLQIQALQVVTIGATLILLLVLGLFLRKTRLGLEMRAAAEDHLMARMLGVRADLVIIVAVVVAGLLAAVASLLFVAQSGQLSYQMGAPLMMYAFIATVIGGVGRLSGAVLGAYLVATLGVLAHLMLPLDLRPFRDAFVFLGVIAVLLWRPTGLFPARATRERV